MCTGRNICRFFRHGSNKIDRKFDPQRPPVRAPYVLKSRRRFTDATMTDSGRRNGSEPVRMRVGGGGGIGTDRTPEGGFLSD
jgi:hypothetical protein